MVVTKSVVLTPEAFDDLLDKIEDSVRRLRAAQGSMVKQTKAELNLLEHVESARYFMNEVLREGRCRLQIIFGGDSVRISRIRAALDAANFSEMNAHDQRLSSCLGVCESVEKVVLEQGLGQEQQHPREVASPVAPPECGLPSSLPSLLTQPYGPARSQKSLEVIPGTPIQQSFRESTPSLVIGSRVWSAAHNPPATVAHATQPLLRTVSEPRPPAVMQESRLHLPQTQTTYIQTEVHLTPRPDSTQSSSAMEVILGRKVPESVAGLMQSADNESESIR